MVSRRRLSSLGRHRLTCFCAATLAQAIAFVAHAQETDPALMAEPISYTDVADAFDERDMPDIDVRLGFRSSISGGPIAREVVDQISRDGRSGQNVIEIGRYRSVRNELLVGLRVGLFHDLMLTVNMPIVLGEENELRPRSGEPCTAERRTSGCEVLREPMSDGMLHPLFALDRPLVSATRSGLPYVDIGLAWGVSNQYKHVYWPTWVLIVDTSLDLGETMRACLTGEGCEPGISRGVARLGLESRWSYRFRYLEPFMGIAHDFVWVSGGEEAFDSERDRVVDGGPPQITKATLGTAVIPWEDRERAQRFEIDLRGTATLITSGRDFSPLFDALGTSENAYLTAANADRLDGTGNPVAFTGVTNVEAHTQLGIDLEIVMQAARYVRFLLGIGVDYRTAHAITGAAPCDTEASGIVANDGCQAGVYNPVYRPVIDAPGKRFLLDGDTTLRLQAAATGQF